MPKSKIKIMQIGIIRLSALGDITQSMIALDLIKRKVPESSIDWFVDEKFKGLLEYNPNIRKIHYLNFPENSKKKIIRTVFSLRRQLRNVGQYDYVIDLQGLIKSSLISYLIKAKYRCGFDKKSIKESVASLFYNKKYNASYGQNVILRYLGLVSFSLNFDYEREYIENKTSYLFYKNNKVIDSYQQKTLIFVGASFKSKELPIKLYHHILSRVDTNFLILWGNEREYHIAKELAEKYKNVEISKKLNLNQLKGVIANSNLVIGADTGPVHMAWALCKPSLILFGPTLLERNTYLTDINKALATKQQVDVYKIPKEGNFFDNLDYDEVVDVLEELLNLNKL